MSHAMDSKQAQAYLIDPMTAPEPAQETGLGSHFTSTFVAPKSPPQKASPRSPKHTPTSSLSSNNPFRADSPHQTPSSKDHSRTHSRNVSKSKEGFPAYRAEAFGDFEGSRPRSQSSSARAGQPQVYEAGSEGSKHRRRTSSLKQRFPGDESTEPLKIIRRDSRKAYKAPHLRKHHIPGADMVDRLDPSIGGQTYHHEGPYDAALLARNSSFENSPVAALQSTNAEALKATPVENIRDAVERHRPLEGTAQIPPGMPDRFGRVYTYEEGADLMHEGMTDAGYKRWPGQVYHKDDLKGKGEPSFSLDRALKAHKINDDGIEMEDRGQPSSNAEQNGANHARSTGVTTGNDAQHADAPNANEASQSSAVRRSGSLRAAGEGLKRRIGSLRHKKKDSH